MPMIHHQLIGKNAAWIANEPFSENALERLVIGILVENNRTSIASIQGLLDRILLVGAFGAGHS